MLVMKMLIFHLSRLIASNHRAPTPTGGAAYFARELHSQGCSLHPSIVLTPVQSDLFTSITLTPNHLIDQYALYRCQSSLLTYNIWEDANILSLPI